MKAFILLGIVLLAGLFVPAHTADSANSNYPHINKDTISAIVEKTIDSFSKTIHANDAEWQQQQTDRNINNLVELQQESRTKKKNAAILRIAIGIGFLILLIVGLRRKGKK
jgi:hypothetical protein